jgi:hypothetical protein
VDTRKLGRYAATAVVSAAGVGAVDGVGAQTAAAFSRGSIRDCLQKRVSVCSYPLIHKLSNTSVEAVSGQGHELCISYFNSAGNSYHQCASYDVYAFSYHIAPYKKKAAEAHTRDLNTIYWDRAYVFWPPGQ